MDSEQRQPRLKLGDRVRFTKRMAGFKVERYSDGYVSDREKTTDPTDGLPKRWQAASDRLKELNPDAGYGHYRVVVTWDVPPRREWDLINHDTGIIVGKTFRYEGRVHFEEGCMSHVGGLGGKYREDPKRVPCWEVKQTLNRRPVLVPLDAVELIDG